MKHALEEIELTPGTVVIADLHLDVGDPEHVESFARWLDTRLRLPRLLILGDLFDVWVGPAQARSPGSPRVLAALAALCARGTPIELVPGNRDFLLDRSFETSTGVRLHAEGFVGVVQGARTLFVHGDTLCTRDVGYQRLRRVLRSGPVTWLAPRIPLVIGRGVARRLRRASVRAIALKHAEEKSIQTDAVVAAAHDHACTTVVCGHAHEYKDVALGQGERRVRLLVLDAFGGQRDLVRVDERGVWAAQGSSSGTAG